MSSTESISQQLATIVAAKAKLPVEEITPDLDLEASGLDSIARVELLMQIEDEFLIEFTDSETAAVSTVADLVAMIAGKVDANG